MANILLPALIMVICIFSLKIIATYTELFAYSPSEIFFKVQKVAQRNYGQSINVDRYLVDVLIVIQDFNVVDGGTGEKIFWSAL